MTLSRYPCLSSIASGRSSGLHPVSTQSCCMYVRAGRPAFGRPCEGVHKSTSLMRWPLLLQLCPACLVRLILIVFVMGGRWPYNCCFVGCCFVDLFNITFLSFKFYSSAAFINVSGVKVVYLVNFRIIVGVLEFSVMIVGYHYSQSLI